jgi:hypothetical protein
MAEPRIMSPREFGISIGYAQGQTIEGAELRAFERQYEEYRKQAVAGWEMSKDNEGNLVRVNPHTGLVMTMTNQAGQPVKAGDGNPFAGYMGPGGGAPAVAGAAVDPSSAAFAGVQPSPMPAAAPQGNAVAPVNVNPAQPAAAPAAAPAAVAAAAAKVYKTENEVIADARMGYLSKAQAQAILVNQFGLDP